MSSRSAEGIILFPKASSFWKLRQWGISISLFFDKKMNKWGLTAAPQDSDQLRILNTRTWFSLFQEKETHNLNLIFFFSFVFFFCGYVIRALEAFEIE